MWEIIFNKFKSYNPLSITYLIILLILILVAVWSVIHYNAQPGTPVSVFKLITYNKNPGSDLLRIENENLKKIIEKLKSESEIRVESGNDSLKGKIQELENKLTDHRKFIDKVVADRQNLTKELAEKTKQIIELENHKDNNTDLNTNYMKLQVRVSTLHEQIEGIQRELEFKNTELQKLKSDSKQFNDKIRKASSQIKKLSKELSDKNNEIERLKTKTQ